jgi:hypothetical protein
VEERGDKLALGGLGRVVLRELHHHLVDATIPVGSLLCV